jgi:hypothetical protein
MKKQIFALSTAAVMLLATSTSSARGFVYYDNPPLVQGAGNEDVPPYFFVIRPVPIPLSLKLRGRFFAYLFEHRAAGFCPANAILTQNNYNIFRI